MIFTLTHMGAVQEAAELVASRSCGEGWLLQPKIADMPEMEYRCDLAVIIPALSFTRMLSVEPTCTTSFATALEDYMYLGPSEHGTAAESSCGRMQGVSDGRGKLDRDEQGHSGGVHAGAAG